jgi:gliding motility-associated-like protein
MDKLSQQFSNIDQNFLCGKRVCYLSINLYEKFKIMSDIKPVFNTNINSINKLKRSRIFLLTILFLMITGKIWGQPLNASISGTAAVCKNGTSPEIIFTAINGTPTYTFTYNINGGSPLTVSTNGSHTTVSVFSPTGTAGTFTYNLESVTDGFPTTVSATGSAIITITALPIATFSYTTTPYCSNETNPFPTFGSGAIAGTFSSTAGLVFVNTSTGQVNLAASTPGTYTVTNTIAATGGCGVVTATSPITITKLPIATFNYSTTPYCSNEPNPSPTFSFGAIAGTFSSTAGLVFINTLTGQVNLTASIAGTYTVTNTIQAAGGCGVVTATSPITITSFPSAIISFTGSSWCRTAGVQNVTLVGTSGGTFSAPAGLSIDASTGSITPATSTSGTYVVAYTIAASGGCGITTATTSVTILTTPSAPTVGAITQTTCSTPTGSILLNDLPSTGTWVLTRDPGGVTTPGSGTSASISNLAPGSYTFTVTNSVGCVSPSSASVAINPQPASPSAPVQSVDCSLGFGHAVITVTSPTGAGLEYSLDGGIYQTSNIFNLVNNGSHYLSVRNPAGCTTTGGLFVISCGCINPPTITLSSSSSNTCGTTAVTITGNSFGGTATSVTITSNGSGSVNPSSAITSPFSFTYTPSVADGDKTVIITVTTNNPLGAPCVSGVGTYTLTVNSMPTPPAIGTITNLTCAVPTGSVVLNGLPSAGTWTLIRNPGDIITSGTGTGTTVTGLAAGTYNFIVTSAQGCTSVSSGDVVISPPPSSPTAPVVGIITQPTCAISTGTVVLSGLPVTGNWTLTRTPGGLTFSGTGTTATISALPAGTYTFTVTNSTGCISSPSGNVLVNVQPPIPAAPSIGAITPPTCAVSTGSVILLGLPSSGTWTLIRYPGTVSTSGTGTSSTIAGLPSGSYNFTVTTADGCLSVPSANVLIPAQPSSPTAPAVGTITQPTFAVPTGSVVLSGLPSSGTWVITQLPGSVTTTGTGISKTITNLEGGVFTFRVTNASGCTSAESVPVTISTPGAPVLIITDPSTVCSPATVDITLSAITAGSTPGLTYTYWTDPEAKIVYGTPTTATGGTYYIKGTTVSGYFSIKPVTVTIDQLPVPNAGVDQNLEYQFSTTLDAAIIINETGIWSLISGSGNFYESTDPKTSVSDLSPGDNLLLWTIKNGVCPAVFDTVNIVVNNLVIPTLITPNMDGKNDYFVLRGLTTLGETKLVIFDRRGVEVYKNLNYDNSWNGVDYNNNPLSEDTYFYVLNSVNGKSISGYIVIRR